MSRAPAQSLPKPPRAAGAARPLTGTYVPQALEILKAASTRSASLGSRGWTSEEISERSIAASAARGELFGWIAGGRLLGCLLIVDDDPVHWPDDRKGEALYLHKLAVAPSACGQGVGDRLIDFAVRLARQSKRAFLRLDTMPDGPLISYYERRGFQTDPDGPSDYAGRWLIRMERTVAPGSTSLPTDK